MTVREIPKSGGEKDLLVAFLNCQRAVIIDKCRGLDATQLATRLEPSTMTLPGIAYHLAVVEEDWFASDFLGEDLGEPWASVDWEANRDWEWDVAPTMDIDGVLGAYERAIERANAIVADTDSLDQLSVKAHPRTGERWSLRWILMHMIEETARHAGHADLIRESIDGETGDFRVLS